MKNYKITVNGNAYDVTVEESDGSAVSQTAPAPVSEQKTVPLSSAGAQIVRSPMPGTILDVRVKSGESVKKGQVLVILEAMKMENEILAPSDAAVDTVFVNKGDMVEVNANLVALK